MTILFQIATFLFVLSILGLLRYTTNFFVATFSNPPKKIEYTDREILLIGSILSFIITYLIFL